MYAVCPPRSFPTATNSLPLTARSHPHAGSCVLNLFATTIEYPRAAEYARFTSNGTRRHATQWSERSSWYCAMTRCVSLTACR